MHREPARMNNMAVYDMKHAKHSKGNVCSTAAITTDVLFNCSCLISPCAGGLLALACDRLCIVYCDCIHITLNFIKKVRSDDKMMVDNGILLKELWSSALTDGTF